MVIRVFKVTLVLGLLLTLFLGFSVLTGGGGAPKEVLIPRGVAVSKIGTLLRDEGILSSPTAFKILVMATGGNRHIKAGEYAFKKNMGFINAVYTLYFSEPIEHVVTIPPGWNSRQIAGILAAQKLIDPAKFLQIVLSPKMAEKYKFKAPSLEGFLFPDTYTFSRIDGEERIVERMVQHFRSKVDANLIAQAKAKGLSLENLVTLASIIEKETGVATERELISSVFHNRLQKKMRLQSDPTTIYGIPNFNGNLTRKDLLTSTPYNTYTISGLPPGAIASPGLAAMLATVNPANSKYLYFVANNQGAHIFSETYAEHSAHVDHFQKRRATRRETESLRQPARKP